MSALFGSGNGILTSFSEIPQTLELRSVPIVYQNPHTWQSSEPFANQPTTEGFETMVQDKIYTLGTDWMYTAIIQTALKGPEPAWSQDDWSFVPVSVSSDLKDPASVRDKSSNLRGDRSLSNLTVETSAIRARLDCSAVEWPRNLSQWLIAQNRTTEPVMDGQVLYEFSTNTTGLDNYFWPRRYVRGSDGNATTSLTAQGKQIQCCANLTQNSPYNPGVVAYWTENSQPSEESFSQDPPNRNHTVKWIRGPVGFAPIEYDIDMEGTLFFSDPPAIQALNCMPTFESSRATVTVEPQTGIVLQHHILDTPLREDVAWSDTFLWRIPTVDARNITVDVMADNTYDSYNVTTR
jgi:hypothetical protein